MKNTFIFFLVLFVFGCKNQEHNTPVKKNPKESIEIEKQAKEIKYVTAKSGLVYRDKPKGKKLGKFEFNEKVDIHEYTSIFQEIKDGKTVIKGEWVGITLGNKNVYVFDGFLSKTKTPITLADVKLFMGDVIWISEEFKTILKETKIFSKAYNCEFYSDIAYYDEGTAPQIIGDRNFMEPYRSKIDHNLSGKDFYDGKTLKITHINNKVLIIEKDSKKYHFTKSSIKKHPSYIVGGVDTASFHFFINWFDNSSFVFNSSNGTKNYTAQDVKYWLDGDIIEIRKKTYSIDNVEKDTYFLSEVKVVWEDEIDFSTSKTGNKATLKKIEKPTK